jgi:26S proteasome regulatory subunit N2
MPKMEFLSNAAPSAFAYPPKTEPPKAEVKNKVETAVLSITAKTKATKKKEQEKKTQEEAAASAMVVDEKAAEATVEPEAEFALLANPARVVRPQLPKIAFPASARFQPVRAVSLCSR